MWKMCKQQEEKCIIKKHLLVGLQKNVVHACVQQMNKHLQIMPCLRLVEAVLSAVNLKCLQYCNRSLLKE